MSFPLKIDNRAKVSITKDFVKDVKDIEIQIFAQSKKKKNVPINTEGSKRTATLIGHLSSLTKNKQTKQKSYNLMTEGLLSNNTSNNRFKINMTPTCWKTCSPGRRNGTKTLP